MVKIMSCITAGAVSLVGASLWLVFCGLSDIPQHWKISQLDNARMFISVHNFDNQDSLMNSVDLAQTSVIKAENLPTMNNFIRLEPENKQKFVNPTSLDYAPSKENDNALVDTVPIPPRRPSHPKTALTPIAIMHKSIATLSKRNRVERLAVALSEPTPRRDASDALEFYRANPPKLIDVFSIPNR